MLIDTPPRPLARPRQRPVGFLWISRLRVDGLPCCSSVLYAVALRLRSAPIAFTHIASLSNEALTAATNKGAE